jgi:cyclopropane fatty-acyl-phospholipid synthase-like methyltransferase
MILEYQKLNINVGDDEFNSMYPVNIRKAATRHWTPVAVAKKAADYLVKTPGAKVLDIGSGSGKFCMIGAMYTKGNFTGVEQRENLVGLSNRISSKYSISNVNFIHANILEIPFPKYEAFYFYNSFHENIDENDKIDNEIGTSHHLYKYYTDYLNKQLSLMPIGTRLATYWCSGNEIPDSYKLRFIAFEGLLKFWEKAL